MAGSAVPKNCSVSVEGCARHTARLARLNGEATDDQDRKQSNTTTADTKSDTPALNDQDTNKKSGIVEEGYHPLLGKYVRISYKNPYEIEDEDKTKHKPRENASSKPGSAAGYAPGVDPVSTLVVPETKTDLNGTGYVIGNLRNDPGAGSPDQSAILVPALFGGLILVATIMVALIIRKRRNGGFFRKRRTKKCDIELDTTPQNVKNPGEMPTYAQVDKSKKKTQIPNNYDKQNSNTPTLDPSLATGSQRSISIRHSRLSLPPPPPPGLKAPIAEHDTTFESDVENEYDVPGELSSTFGNRNDAGIENVYESTEDNEYALYDAAHRENNGFVPTFNGVPNGILPHGDFEDHIYESTEGDDHIYEATEWPSTRAPLPPFRPMSLPVLKTPPQIRPGHLLPRTSRPNTIAASPSDVDKSEYESNIEDYEAYLSPICHNHSWSPYHSYDPVYEKKNKKNSSSNMNSSSRDDPDTSNGSSDSRNKPIENGVASDSDSSVYEYIEGGDNRNSTLKSERGKARTDSMAVHVGDTSRCSPVLQSTTNIEEDEYEHEYTPLIETSS